MNEPTQEQQERFWEWCGWYWWEDGQSYTYGASEVSRDLPDIDLNNLFKYAVPKLYQFGLLECSFHRDIDMFGDNREILKEEKVSYRWRLLLESKILNLINGCGDTPALALFWAIYQAAGLTP